MTPRLRAGREVRVALGGLSLVAGLLGGVVGCGAGDDTVSVVPLVRDGGSDADANADATSIMPVQEAGPEESGPADATTMEEVSEGGGDAGSAVAVLSLSPIAFGNVNCGASKSQTLALSNSGTGPLAVSATTTGSAFSVTPMTPVMLDPGEGDAGLTIVATITGSATAGTLLTGSLNLFTNDPDHPSVIIPLSATPTGATVTSASSAFPATESGATSDAGLVFTNSGNAAATIAIGAASDPQFSLSGAVDGGATLTLTPGASSTVTANFSPASTTTATASAVSTVTVGGATCGTNVASISYSGAVGHGSITANPPTVDFGPVDCGPNGGAPGLKFITLTNSAAVPVTIMSATIAGQAGFQINGNGGAPVQGAVIPPGSNNSNYVITVHPAPVPYPYLSANTPITAQLTLATDATPSTLTITLTEEPNGAVLAFDTSATPSFGSFGPIVLLQAASQNFSVTNGGSAAANVTLSLVSDSDARSPAFTLSNSSFTATPNSPLTDSVVFSPTATTNTASLTMNATGPLCAPLPAPIQLTGSGIGGGPSVSATSLSFSATCGAPAPAAQSFTVKNNGQLNMNWDLSAVTGPGTPQYTVSSSPAPGLLAPGASATVTVTAAAIPSPAPNPTPSAYAASLTVTTDVPFDDPHVISLAETPLGDQLSLSASSLRFGQFPINQTTVPETFTVTNNANVGSPSANVSLAIGGTSASAYSVVPAAQSNIAPGGGVSGPENVTFDPSSSNSFPSIVALTTSDPLCTPLPNPIRLSGTGAQGKVSVSTSTIAFGTDASDPHGLVNCAATGLAHSFTVSNTGNAAFRIAALTLGLGATSPYVLSGDASTLPATLPIGGSATITITPKAIPAAVADPNDSSPFIDTLTLTTNAALDSPHTVSLVMQARGAVISDTPLTTTWNFGTVGSGTIGTFTSTITNTGNAAASVAFSGQTQPTIFGLQNNPTTVIANAVTPVVGQFSPPSANGQWSDHGTLTVSPAQVFCEPLPTAWTTPQIDVSGSSNGNPPVTVSGTLTFPTTNCGSAAPAGQAVTLTNNTNQAYAFSTTFNSGAFYTAHVSPDAGGGTIPANGSATIVVTPTTVTPGPDVSAGSAPYADDLLITIQSTPATTFTIPISWTLNGAVLSLPQGGGPNHDTMGTPFYAADSNSGFALPMDNTGTATATVTFGMQPTTAFTFSPAPPIMVQPGIEALPLLSSTNSDATCPARTSGSATFLYSGPVCRPFPVPQVDIQSCVGTF